MGLTLGCFLVGLGISLGSVVTAVPIAFDKFNATNTITRDVCVIGGGATGTYSAIRLRDMGKSVVVVESKNRMGGHTETYTDPATQTTLDIGVEVWHNLTIVKDYFARLNVSLTDAKEGSSGSSTYADFSTGRVVANYTPSDPTDALAAWGAQLALYPYVETGFDLEYPVPADLLLPFEYFVSKHSLQAMVQTVVAFGQGLGDLLCQPTLYVMKNFGTDILRSLQAGYVTTTKHDNSLLYENARAELGPDVLLSSTIVAMDRSSTSGVKIIVQTPTGKVLIHANKLIFTIPPKLPNLSGFDLSPNETTLFRQFGHSAYYTGLIRHSGIPDNLTVVNVGATTPQNTPVLPAVYAFNPTGVPDLHRVKFGSPYALASDAEVQTAIVASLRRLQQSDSGGGAVPAVTATNATEFAVFASHTPFELTVSSEAIAGGFYRELNALQGQRHTYYTGAAFHTHDSSLLWQFTEPLLPRVVA